MTPLEALANVIAQLRLDVAARDAQIADLTAAYEAALIDAAQLRAQLAPTEGDQP